MTTNPNNNIFPKPNQTQTQAMKITNETLNHTLDTLDTVVSLNKKIIDLLQSETKTLEAMKDFYEHTNEEQMEEERLAEAKANDTPDPSDKDDINERARAMIKILNDIINCHN